MRMTTCLTTVLLFASCAAPTALRTESVPRASAPQRVEAGGDVLQQLRQSQRTATRTDAASRSQRVSLADRVRDVGRVEQAVDAPMYGPSPEQLELERDRLGKQATLGLAGVGVLVGLALFALWAPSVGGAWLAIAAIVLITLSVIAPLALLLL